MVAAVIGNVGIELWRLSKDGCHLRTGIHELMWEPVNFGWQVRKWQLLESSSTPWRIKHLFLSFEKS
jgi:hypothetical protein